MSHKLLKDTDITVQCPRHVALIMDGNTRWAEQRGLRPVEGHKQGVEVLRSVVEYSAKRGIEYLTAFTFSSENWRRSEEEIEGLMGLFTDSLEKESGRLADNNIALRFIGERSRLDSDLQELMTSVEEQRPNDVCMTLILAIDYGGRHDITNACKHLARMVEQGVCGSDDIDESMIGNMLSLAGVPDPELCIRTSNEHRISNFLLWQLAYSELHFTPVLWPDFSAEHMEKAIADYARRIRRYGASSVVTI